MLVVTVTATATVMAKGKERVGSRSRNTRGTSRLGNRLSVGQWGFFLLGRGSGVGRTGYVLWTQCINLRVPTLYGVCMYNLA